MVVDLACPHTFKFDQLRGIYARLRRRLHLLFSCFSFFSIHPEETPTNATKKSKASDEDEISWLILPFKSFLLAACAAAPRKHSRFRNFSKSDDA